MRGAIFSMPRPVRRVLAVMLALAVFTAFALAIFEEPLVENFGTIQWDAISVHFFNLYFSSDAWHGGALPLWTPYLFGGFPQIADLQVAVFYPINLAIGLLATFTPELVLYQVVTHYVLAALFAFLFAYHLSRNLLFSLGGGLAYAFGGFMVGHAAHVGMQNTATWLPLILLLLIVGLERQKIVYGVWAGLSLGIALLAGHFQTALYAMFALGLYGVFDTGWVVLRGVIVPVIARARSAPGNPGAGAHRDGTAASASESAAAIGRATTKRAGILVAAFLIAFLIAAIQILPTQELTARSQRSAITLELSQTESLEPSSLAGLVFPNYRNVARGAYEGPWDRTQNYLYVTVTLLACALLGFALGTLLSGRRKLAVFFALLLLVSTLYSIGSYGFLHEYFYRYVPLFDKTRAPANMMVLANLALLGLASIGAAVLNRSARLRALGVPLVLGLAASIAIGVELWNALKDNELLWARKSTEEILAEPWIAANIANEYGALSPMERFTVFGIPEFADNSTQYRKIENFDGYNPLRLMRHAQYVDAMVEHPELVDLAGIKYLPCRYIASRAPTLKRVGELCINDRFLPRAFFADNYVVAAHTADALAKLRMVEVASTLVLEEVPAQEPEEGALNGFGTVDIVQTRPGYWKLLTRTERDRLLFFRQTHYPGWTATIDGVPADLYRANVLFQALAIPKGEHTVVLAFHSSSLRVGMLLTVAGLALVCVVSIGALAVCSLGLRSGKR